MDTEELRVLIHTVADTTGAAQTNAALRTVNTQGEQANTSLKRAGQSAREAGVSFGQGSENITRFVGALTGVELGLSLFTSAGEKVREVLKGSIEAQADAERTTRATAAAYGAAAGQYQEFAATLSQSTGFTSQAILEAALSARTLSQNYGLTIQQTQRLITVSADLARVRGIGVAESFERIQSAIRGEAEASEFLGLTLNATFLQQNAANGAYRQTFATLSDAQRAQIVYNEVLRQSAQFSGLSTQAAKGLDGAMGQASLSAHNLSIELGRLIEPKVISGLQATTTAALALQTALRGLAEAQSKVPQIQFGDLARSAAQTIPVLGSAVVIIGALAAGEQKLEQIERDRIAEQQNRALITKQLLDDQLDIQSQLGAARGISTQTPIVTGLNEALRNTHTTLQAIAQDISGLGTRGGSLNTVLEALNPTDIQGRATVQAQQALQQIDAQVIANRALLAIEHELAQEREATKITDPRDAAGAIAARQRLAVIEQLTGAEHELLNLQEGQRQIQAARAQLSQQEAQVSLAALGQRRAIQREIEQLDANQAQRARQVAQVDRDQAQRARELSNLDREINDVLNQRLRLQQESAHIGAELASLPSQFALEDAQGRIERARLVAADRTQGAGARTEARRQIRAEERALPGRELAAFDAAQGLRQVERQQRITGLEGRAAQIPLEERRIGLEEQVRVSQEIVDAIHEQARVLDEQDQASRTGLENQLKATQDIVDAIHDQSVQLDMVATANTAAITTQQDRLAAIIADGLAAQTKTPASVNLRVEIATPTGDPQVVYQELIQANGQAIIPPVVQLSGVRRG